jgi:phosphate transport system substrate-binding protein
MISEKMKTLFSSFILFSLLGSCIKDPHSEETVIKIKGSESEFNLINYFTTQYRKKDNKVEFQIAGGGSGLGIEALSRKEVHIAISSRLINDNELEEARRNGVIPVQSIVALDAVAIIVNPQTYVDSLSLQQLSDILSGKIKNWKELNGHDLPVTVFGRDNHSGTGQYLKERLNIEEYTPSARCFAENKSIIAAVARQKGSIGYVNLGSIVSADGKPIEHVWAVSVYYDGGKAHTPYEKEAIKAGEYPLVRPLYQYTIGYPRNEILDFINFELSDEQQGSLEPHGYFPIQEIHKVLNYRNRHL